MSSKHATKTGKEVYKRLKNTVKSKDNQDSFMHAVLSSFEDVDDDKLNCLRKMADILGRELRIDPSQNVIPNAVFVYAMTGAYNFFKDQESFMLDGQKNSLLENEDSDSDMSDDDSAGSDTSSSSNSD